MLSFRPAQFEEALADKAEEVGMATITLAELGAEFIKVQERCPQHQERPNRARQPGME